MSDFVSFPLIGFTLVIKLRNIDLKVTEGNFFLIEKKNDDRFKYALLNSVD